MLKNNHCDVCGNDDLPAPLIKAELGSFTRCSICLRAGAGIPNDPRFIKNTVHYDNGTDTYLRNGKMWVMRPYKAGVGKVFKTRKEMVAFLKSLK